MNNIIEILNIGIVWLVLLMVAIFILHLPSRLGTILADEIQITIDRSSKKIVYIARVRILSSNRTYRNDVFEMTTSFKQYEVLLDAQRMNMPIIFSYEKKLFRKPFMYQANIGWK